MTYFSDIKNPHQPPTAHRHHDAESGAQTDTPWQATAGNDVCFSKPNEIDRRPTLRRIVSARIYPEGGTRAWLVVLGCFSGIMASFGFMATIGVFQEYLTSNQLKKHGESMVGWIFSVYVFLSFFGGLQVGPVFDINGPRLLLIAGSVCLVLGLLLMAESTQYWHFMVSIGILSGIGTSLIFTPCVSSVGHFFRARRALATGISAAGGAAGGVIFPLLLISLFPRIGWAWATRVLAAICGCLCVASILLVRSSVGPEKGGANFKVAQTGMSQYLPDLRILRHKSFALTTAGVFFMEWGLFVPIAYISSFALHTGAADLHLASSMVTLLNAGSALGRIVPGLFADRIGRFNSMIVLLLLCGVAALGLWLPATLLHDVPAVRGMTILFSVLFGFASGANISLTPVCIGQLCSTASYGRYYATCYTLVSFGTLTGIPIAGMLINLCDGSYFGVVIFTVACYVVGTLCFVAARVLEVGWAIKGESGKDYIVF
jgi:MFS family permease